MYIIYDSKTQKAKITFHQEAFLNFHDQHEILDSEGHQFYLKDKIVDIYNIE